MVKRKYKTVNTMKNKNYLPKRRNFKAAILLGSSLFYLPAISGLMFVETKSFEENLGMFIISFVGISIGTIIYFVAMNIYDTVDDYIKNDN